MKSSLLVSTAVLLCLGLASCQQAANPAGSGKGQVCVEIASLPGLLTKASKAVTWSRALGYVSKVHLELYAGSDPVPRDSWDITGTSPALQPMTAAARSVPAGTGYVIKVSVYNTYDDASPTALPEVTGVSSPFSVISDQNTTVNVGCLPSADRAVALVYGTESATSQAATPWVLNPLTPGSDLWFRFTPTDASIAVELGCLGGNTKYYGFLYDDTGTVVSSNAGSTCVTLGGIPVAYTVTPGKQYCLMVLDYGTGSADSRKFTLKARYFDGNAFLTKTVTWQDSTLATTATVTGGKVLGTGALQGRVAVMAEGTGFLTAYTDNSNALRVVKTDADGSNATVQLLASQSGNPGSVYLFSVAGKRYLLWGKMGSEITCFTSTDGSTWDTGASMVSGLATASTNLQARHYQASLAGSRVHLVWLNNAYQVVTATYDLASPATVAGVTLFTDPNSAISVDPAVASSGSDVFVTFRRGNPNGQCPLFHSADGGATWDAGPVISGLHYPFSIAMDFDGSSLVLAFDNTGEILVSADKGATFSSYSGGPQTGAALVRDSGHTYLATYGSSSGVVYQKATSAASTWTSVTLPDSVVFSSSRPSSSPAMVISASGNPTLVFLNGLGQVLFQQSVDGGATWQQNSSNVAVIGRIVDPCSGGKDNGQYLTGIRKDNLMIAAHGTRGGTGALRLIRSADNGASWQTGTLFEVNAGLVSLRESGGLLYLVWSASGTWFARSSDNGTTWQYKLLDTASGNGDGLTDLAITGAGATATVVVAYKAYTSSSSSVQKVAVSHDGGATFARQTVDTVLSFSAGRLVASGTTFALVYEDSAQNKLRFASSTTSGDSWSNVDTGLDTGGGGSFALVGNLSGSQFWTQVGTTLWTSSSGTSWTSQGAVGVGSPFFPSLHRVSASLMPMAYYTLSPKALVVTTNTGTSWGTPVTVDPSDAAGTQCVLLPDAGGSDLWALWRSSNGYGVKLNHSIDGGTTWAY